MKLLNGKGLTKKSGILSGFTLVEVVISMVILAVLIQGVVLAYTSSARRAEWSAHSLAAQSMASQGAEQARCAGWNTQKWPVKVGPGEGDELGTTNYIRTDTLDIPINGKPIIATNFVSITTISVNPPLRQIRSDCAWQFMNRSFSNTVILLRAPDQ